MNSGRYFIQDHLGRNVVHGGIGNIDIEKILLNRGFQPLSFPGGDKSGLLVKLQRLMFYAKARSVRCNCLVYQFPQHATLQRKLIVTMQKRQAVKLVCIISDIEGIRFGNIDRLHAEVAFIRQHQYFIVHNQFMHEWLLSVHPTAVAEQLEFFDFLAVPSPVERRPSLQIAFAGNLGKSIFLRHLPGWLSEQGESIDFYLYGQGFDEDCVHPRVHYEGAINPYDLPNVIRGSFGLVWDGDSISGLSGSLGHYLKYNSSHKISLYILASLPLIVPHQTYAATVVEKYGIGISVSEIAEIPEKIASISENSYGDMIRNMRSLADEISSGNMLGTALDRLEKRWKA